MTPIFLKTMLLKNHTLLLLTLFFVQQAFAQCDTIIDVNFDQWDNRRYSIQDAKDDFNNQIKPWTAGSYRGIDAPGADASLIDAVPQETRIVDGTLRAEYTKNDASGRSGGFLFDPYFDGVEEAYLTYRVKFDDNFFWATGGKLPGLGGSVRGAGSETEGRGSIPSGCGYNDDGFSARLMWRRNRAQSIPPYFILYSYFAEKQDGTPRESSGCGDGYRIYTGLEDDTWYNVRQYIKLNTPGERDGVVVMWIDGVETFRKEDALIRKTGRDDVKINALVMNTYRGGARTDTVWHSPRDEFAFFDDVKVWTGGLGCIGVNEIPTLAFSAPANNATYAVGDDIEVTVSASDPDGSVSNVKLYRNDTLVRTIDAAPYTWGGSASTDTLLQNMQTGVYVLRAVVEDDEGSTSSTEITVLVGDVSSAPSLRFSSPADGAEYMQGDDVVIVGEASDIDGTIDNVSLFLNDEFVRTERVEPYEWGHLPDNDPVLKNMAPGTYRLKLVAEDNAGLTSEAEITITVKAVSATASSLEQFIRIQPNASARSVTIHLPSVLLNEPYGIFDINGRKVRTVKPQREVEELDIADFPSGLYVINFGEVGRRFVRL